MNHELRRSSEIEKEGVLFRVVTKYTVSLEQPGITFSHSHNFYFAKEWL